MRRRIKSLLTIAVYATLAALAAVTLADGWWQLVASGLGATCAIHLESNRHAE